MAVVKTQYMERREVMIPWFISANFAFLKANIIETWNNIFKMVLIIRPSKLVQLNFHLPVSSITLKKWEFYISQ